MTPRSYFFSIACACLPTLAFANSEATAPGLPAGTFLQAFFGLGLIVALLVGLAWFARKLTGGQIFGQGGMRIVGGIALGPRERLVLVEVGEEWLVIGIVPGQIRTLHRLPKGSLAEPPPGADKPFAQWLKQVTERRGHAS
mgnify:CR=1 FL=1